jgi:hypothetical protein
MDMKERLTIAFASPDKGFAEAIADDRCVQATPVACTFHALRFPADFNQ